MCHLSSLITPIIFLHSTSASLSKIFLFVFLSVFHHQMVNSTNARTVSLVSIPVDPAYLIPDMYQLLSQCAWVNEWGSSAGPDWLGVAEGESRYQGWCAGFRLQHLGRWWKHWVGGWASLGTDPKLHLRSGYRCWLGFWVHRFMGAVRNILLPAH